MIPAMKQSHLTDFFKLFSDQFRLRPTRIGVFEGEPGSLVDYWLEDGLPLIGIDVDTKGENSPTIQIMLGKADDPGTKLMTHVVKDTRSAKIVLSADGSDDGLEIRDKKGRTTFLRFENFES